MRLGWMHLQPPPCAPASAAELLARLRGRRLEPLGLTADDIFEACLADCPEGDTIAADIFVTRAPLAHSLLRIELLAMLVWPPAHVQQRADTAFTAGALRMLARVWRQAKHERGMSLEVGWACSARGTSASASAPGHMRLHLCCASSRVRLEGCCLPATSLHVGLQNVPRPGAETLVYREGAAPGS